MILRLLRGLRTVLPLEKHETEPETDMEVSERLATTRMLTERSLLEINSDRGSPFEELLETLRASQASPSLPVTILGAHRWSSVRIYVKKWA